MERRQAILLFVLALVAGMLAVSIAGGPADEDDGEDAPPPPRTSERSERAPRSIEATFDPDRPSERTVERGTRVELAVDVPSPGEVELRALGLSGFAVPGTPARFDILAEEPGRYDARYIPLEGEPQRAGTLIVR